MFSLGVTSCLTKKQNPVVCRIKEACLYIVSKDTRLVVLTRLLT